MNSEEIVKAALQLLMLGLEIYFIYWTIKTVKRANEKIVFLTKRINGLSDDSKTYYREIMTLNQRIKELEKKENNNTLE